jgi:hypothetical protein
MWRHACWAVSSLIPTFGMLGRGLEGGASGPVLDFAIAFVHTVRAACALVARGSGVVHGGRFGCLAAGVGPPVVMPRAVQVAAGF